MLAFASIGCRSVSGFEDVCCIIPRYNCNILSFVKAWIVKTGTILLVTDANTWPLMTNYVHPLYHPAFRRQSFIVHLAHALSLHPSILANSDNEIHCAQCVLLAPGHRTRNTLGIDFFECLELIWMCRMFCAAVNDSDNPPCFG